MKMHFGKLTIAVAEPLDRTSKCQKEPLWQIVLVFWFFIVCPAINAFWSSSIFWSYKLFIIRPNCFQIAFFERHVIYDFVKWLQHKIFSKILISWIWHFLTWVYEKLFFYKHSKNLPRKKVQLNLFFYFRFLLVLNEKERTNVSLNLSIMLNVVAWRGVCAIFCLML